MTLIERLTMYTIVFMLGSHIVRTLTHFYSLHNYKKMVPPTQFKSNQVPLLAKEAPTLPQQQQQQDDEENQLSNEELQQRYLELMDHYQAHVRESRIIVYCYGSVVLLSYIGLVATELVFRADKLVDVFLIVLMALCARIASVESYGIFLLKNRVRSFSHDPREFQQQIILSENILERVRKLSFFR